MDLRHQAAVPRLSMLSTGLCLDLGLPPQTAHAESASQGRRGWAHGQVLRTQAAAGRRVQLRTRKGIAPVALWLLGWSNWAGAALKNFPMKTTNFNTEAPG